MGKVWYNEVVTSRHETRSRIRETSQKSSFKRAVLPVEGENCVIEVILLGVQR